MNSKLLLADDGVLLVEVAYLSDLLGKNLFDSVYHEHVCYWAVAPIKVFFSRLGMEIIDVVPVATHGGSIRVLVQKVGGPRRISPHVSATIRHEAKMGLHRVATYKNFAGRVAQNRTKLTSLLARLRQRGATIAGYGAPAKSTTLLHYFGIDNQTLVFIVDDSPLKQGLYTPGTHIPVVESTQLYERRPDYVLVLAWNFAQSIMQIHNRYHQDGGKFIIPVPRPTIQ